MKTIYSLCGMCGTRCPIAVETDGKRAVWVQGNPHSPTGTALCPRGMAALALEQDSERPLAPLIRTGKRGEGHWREADWEEALDLVAKQLKDIQARHGRESVMLSDRSGPFTDLYEAFARGLGTPNRFNHDVTCTRNVQLACKSVLGLERGRLVIDYRRSRHIVLQGRNVFEALNISEAAAVSAAKANGCRLTVMDIRATVSAAKADTFFLVRPGTDYAMNLAVLNTLITERLYSREAVRFMHDFAELEAFVRPYTAQWAEAETGVPAAQIIRLVHELAADAPQVIWYPGWFTARYSDSFLSIRSAYLINALLGSIGEQGGMPISLPGRALKRLQPLAKLYPKAEAPKADRSDWQEPGLIHRAFAAAETGVPYPVRAYLSIRHNILSSLPDPDALRRMLDKLELIVAVTTTWSATAAYADVVLPLSPALSRESILGSKAGLSPQFFRRARAVAPRFNTRADWEILCGLAARLGLDKLAFPNIEAIWAYQLEGTGLRIEDFEATGLVPLLPAPQWQTLAETALATPSGKIEARSGTWLKAGKDTLAPYVSPVRPENGHFRLIPGRAATHTQASTANNPLLFDLLPENELWIHTDRARELGIVNGDTVEVISAAGASGCVKARVTTGIHPEAVFLLHGFGHALPQETRAAKRGLADECLMSGGLGKEDSLGGGLALQEHFVRVRKAPVSAQGSRP